MIKYDSEICDNIINNIKEAKSTLESEISNKITSDYSALKSVGLFSTQLSNLSSGAKTLIESYDSFLDILSTNKNLWAQVQEDVGNEIGQFDTEVNGGNYVVESGGNYYGGVSGGSSVVNEQNNVEKVSKGKEITTNDVKEFLSKIEFDVTPVLLQKVKAVSKDTSIVDLILDKSKAVELVVALKKILGDTSNAEISELDAETIQKIILQRLKIEDIDITTEDGYNQAEKVILQQLNTEVDEAKWNELLYGDNTVKMDLLDGTWVVAKTATDITSYEAYTQSNGVRQDANPDEWGDSCLAFAEAHTYDLITGNYTPGETAAGYNCGGSFEDYMSDSKEEVLAKVYEEIMNGRPMVIQVNGNVQGTSRHFVTVVGFKEGVVSGATLKEEDLLIIDSWDGRIERMDTEKSRFMTSGAMCHKDYSGYRLRILKS